MRGKCHSGLRPPGLCVSKPGTRPQTIHARTRVWAAELRRNECQKGRLPPFMHWRGHKHNTKQQQYKVRRAASLHLITTRNRKEGTLKVSLFLRAQKCFCFLGPVPYLLRAPAAVATEKERESGNKKIANISSAIPVWVVHERACV